MPLMDKFRYLLEYFLVNASSWRKGNRTANFSIYNFDSIILSNFKQTPIQASKPEFYFISSKNGHV